MLSLHTAATAASIGALVAFAPSALGQAQPDSAFTFQFVAENGGQQLDTLGDFTFRAYDAPTGGNLLGEQTLIAVFGEAGLFTVELDLGVAALGPGPRWLEIEILSPDPALLSPRMPLTAAPRSVQAGGAGVEADGSVTFIRGLSDGVTIENLTSGGFVSGNTVWQSFVPPSTGQVTDFELRVNAGIATAGMWKIYEGEGTGGAELATALTTIFETSGFGPLGPRDTDLPDQQVVLQAGQTYTLAVLSEVPINVTSDNNSNSYPGGISNLGARDLRFTITQRTAGDPIAGITGNGVLESSGAKLTSPSPRLRLQSNAAPGNGISFFLFDFNTLDEDAFNDTSWEIGADENAMGLNYYNGFNFSNLLYLNGATESFGFGTATPDADLHLFRSDDPTIKLQSNGNSEFSGRVALRQLNESGFDIYYDGTTGIDKLVVRPLSQGASQVNADIIIGNTPGQIGHVALGVFNNTYRLALPNLASESGRGIANRWDTYSSQRYKTNVETIPDPVETVSKLRGVSFEWNPENGGAHDLGFIAEEVAEVFPDLVTLDDEGWPTSLDYSRLLPVAVEAIKAQQQTIESQQERIERLEAAVEQLLKDADK